MNKAATNLSTFPENLLQWSRSQMNKMEFVPIQIDIAEAVSRAVSLLSPAAQEKNIEIVNNSGAGQFINANNNMLNTILRNLLSNAIKFTENGGTVSISTSNTGDKFYSIKVTDTGIGIDEEDKTRLFKIDQKYNTKGTNNESGSGLGLILCKELIEKHDGEISVESEKGRGSEFIFTMPKHS